MTSPARRPATDRPVIVTRDLRKAFPVPAAPATAAREPAAPVPVRVSRPSVA